MTTTQMQTVAAADRENRELVKALDASQQRMSALLRNVGEPGACRGCRAAITWVRHAGGQLAPYDSDGTNHFVTCPNASEFKKKKAPRGMFT